MTKREQSAFVWLNDALEYVPLVGTYSAAKIEILEVRVYTGPPPRVFVIAVACSSLFAIQQLST